MPLCKPEYKSAESKLGNFRKERTRRPVAQSGKHDDLPPTKAQVAQMRCLEENQRELGLVSTMEGTWVASGTRLSTYDYKGLCASRRPILMVVPSD